MVKHLLIDENTESLEVESPFKWNSSDIVQSINPWHAAEVIQDLNGDWHITMQ